MESKVNGRLEPAECCVVCSGRKTREVDAETRECRACGEYAVEPETVDLMVYRLDRSDDIHDVGRRTLNVHRLVQWTEPDASSRLERTKLVAVKIGRTYYAVENDHESDGHAIYLPPGVKAPRRR